MELMTKLQTEQHSIKDLLTKLNQQEDELKDVREAVSMIYFQTTSLENLSSESSVWPGRTQIGLLSYRS